MSKKPVAQVNPIAASREEGRNTKRPYFLGDACAVCGNPIRYVANGNCRECAKAHSERMNAQRRANAEKTAQIARERAAELKKYAVKITPWEQAMSGYRVNTHGQKVSIRRRVNYGGNNSFTDLRS